MSNKFPKILFSVFLPVSASHFPHLLSNQALILILKHILQEKFSRLFGELEIITTLS